MAIYKIRKEYKGHIEPFLISSFGANVAENRSFQRAHWDMLERKAEKFIKKFKPLCWMSLALCGFGAL